MKCRIRYALGKVGEEQIMSGAYEGMRWYCCCLEIRYAGPCFDSTRAIENVRPR